MPNLLLRYQPTSTTQNSPEHRTLEVAEGVLLENASFSEGDVEQFELGPTELLPGFIDIHNHGAIGIDVNSATADEFIDVGGYLARNGVTGWLPTFVPDSDEAYRRQIERLEKVVSVQDGLPIARVLGVHYEGVFANREMCGALRPEYFKGFKSGDEVSSLPRLSKGVHLTTLAPEIENGVELVRELRKQGWVVSVGHTNADIGVLDRALEAGASHLTHFFNAMTGIHHRNTGVAGWGLTRENVTFDIIADGIHVDKTMLGWACKCKGTDKVSLISDSVSPTGMGDGSYEIWGERVTVTDGRTQNERGSIAGSVITMLDAVRNMRVLGFTTGQVSQMASLNPAKLLGLEGECGSLEAGKRADVVAIDSKGDLVLSIVGGKVVVNNL